jgi:hypothetical protein
MPVGVVTTAGPPSGRDLRPCCAPATTRIIAAMAPSTPSDTLAHGYPSRHPPEVVAVLDDGGSAPHVARVAVDEAARLGVPVRFLEVMGGHVDDEGRALAEEVLFRAGLRALRGHPRTRSVFEVVRGHVGAVVRHRSQGAVLVVVGEGAATGRTLASRCRASAECPVRTVPSASERGSEPGHEPGHEPGPEQVSASGRGTFGPRERASTA